MHDHRTEMREKCKRIAYLPNGALAMEEADLRDGPACHAQIIDHNTTSPAACLTCTPGSVEIDVVYDGTPKKARYAVTDDAIPDWFVRRGILAAAAAV